MVILLSVGLRGRNHGCSYILTDCVESDKKFKCIRTCESVWFKIWNTTAAGEYGQKCDKSFIGKYGDIT